MKHPISSRRWLVVFVGTVLLLVLLVMGFNFCTDPFGAFGDRFFQWWSYDETLNPRVAKLSYLEQNHEKYDSYIIGASSTSSFPTEQLNSYFDASFYNLTMYGADMQDVALTCRYLIDHYTVENLVVSLYIHSAAVYAKETDPLTYNLHYKVDGSSPLLFYGKYLFADPRIGWEKLQHWQNDPYLQQSYRVFHPETGAYDKSRRDAEPIGDLESYIAKPAYTVFSDYPVYEIALPYMEECMESLAAIKEMCQNSGISLTVVCPPMYHEYMSCYSLADQAAFRNALAQVTDYWDFTLSSISFDPRYFYDESHFRNCVGKMALARMFDDDSVYYPEDLGTYIRQGETPGAPQAQQVSEAAYTEVVPILLYHHLAEDGEGSDIISVQRFEEHMAALCDAGYHAITFDDLKAYVEHGTSLPDHPVLITFDDGYASNYTLAYPILKRYNMKATIFVIGVSMGKDTYKDSGEPMIPHFSLAQASEMIDSGVISIQSHSYDLHQVAGRDPEPLRNGVLQMETESDADYVGVLRQDCEMMQELLGYTPSVLAYPYGSFSELSEVVYSEMGIYATVTSVQKTNTIIKGMLQSLRQLGRFSMQESISSEELLQLLES